MPGHAGGKAVIDHDPALGVARDADGFEPQPLGVGAPADRHQHRVGGKALAFGALDLDGHAVARFADLGHLGAELEFDPLTGQHPLQSGCELPVHIRHDPVEQFDHRHFGARAAATPSPIRARYSRRR